MSERPTNQFRPALERLEAKRPLSAGGAAAAVHGLKAGKAAVPVPADPEPAGAARPVHAAKVPIVLTKTRPRVPTNTGPQKPEFGYLVYRITNPSPTNNRLVPPFGQVFVQSKQPIPGQTYNILQVSVRNGTQRTFDSSSSLFVQFPGNPRTYPILTGDQKWLPGQTYIFYVLSKQYYPLPSQVHSGFVFIADGARSVGIPGPSGIFQRVKYDPATFAQTLDKIVRFGPGNQGGIGVHYGLPNTSIYELVSYKVPRNDFSGYF